MTILLPIRRLLGSYISLRSGFEVVCYLLLLMAAGWSGQVGPLPDNNCVGGKNYLNTLGNILKQTEVGGEFSSLVAQTEKSLPEMLGDQVQSLGWEDSLEKEMKTHSGILAWKIPWTEKSSGLQSKASQRVGHNWVTNTSFSLLHLEKLNLEEIKITSLWAFLKINKLCRCWVG